MIEVDFKQVCPALRRMKNEDLVGQRSHYLIRIDPTNERSSSNLCLMGAFADRMTPQGDFYPSAQVVSARTSGLERKYVVQVGCRGCSLVPRGFSLEIEK